MLDNEKRTTFNTSIAQLKNVIQASDNLIPGIAIVSAFFISCIVLVALLSVQLMVGIVLLLVLCFSILVFANTNNYGEAALALVAGLLTAFTVTWTSGTFVAFVTAWFGFSLAAIFISSVKVAARIEDILSSAAQALDPKKIKDIQKQLAILVKNQSFKYLSPTQRAEVIQVLAFRKTPVDLIPDGLQATGILTTITRVNHIDIASFIADVYKIFPKTPSPQSQILLDQMYDIIQNSPASPDEFMQAFRKSRGIVLSGAMSPEQYFRELTNALDQGVPIEDIDDFIRENHKLITDNER